MATAKNLEVINADSKLKQKRGSTASAPVRIGQKTKVKLEQLLRQANKDRSGRKVKTDDLVSFSLSLITDEHLADICNKTLSNRDRMELLYTKLAKEKRVTNREEFLGILLEGRVTI